MLEVADIIRAAGPQACERLAFLPSQKRALRAIQQCRTAALGGQVYGCDRCGQLQYSYHSCGNRHCPKCHGQQTERWLQKQHARLLPCAHYLLTFTLPQQLRGLARSHQKVVYGLLLSSAAGAIQKLCADPQWLGAQPALTGVLHTWTRAMLYHPHAHFLVSAGGLSADGKTWIEAKNPKFLLPVRALSKVFRAKVRDGLKAAGLLESVPAKAWAQNWVVHAQPAGSGQKVLDYLGRYVFRIAISHSRLERLEAGHITFRYRDNRDQQIKRVCLPAAEFLQRFVQHMLPQGLAKVRHYGLNGSACRQRHAIALKLLQTAMPASVATTSRLQKDSATPPPRACPCCAEGKLVWLGRLRPKKVPP